MNGYNAEGNLLDLKISVSLSRCSWLIASPKAAPCYGWALSARLIWGPRAHTGNTRTPPSAHTLSKGHSEAVITSILQLSYCRFMPPSQSFPVGSFVAVRTGEPMSNKVPSAITQLLGRSRTVLHNYFIYFHNTLRGTHTHKPSPSSNPS